MGETEPRGWLWMSLSPQTPAHNVHGGGQAPAAEAGRAVAGALLLSASEQSELYGRRRTDSQAATPPQPRTKRAEPASPEARAFAPEPL